MRSFLACLLLIGCWCKAGPSHLNQIDLKYGPYQVGFTVFPGYDVTRPALKEQLQLPVSQQKGRAVQVSVWFPASGKDDKKGNFKWEYYFRLKAGEIDFSSDAEAVDVARLVASDFKISADSIKQFLFSFETKAVDNARPAPGKFPLILLVHNNAAGFAVMAEYLASFGFVVATCPMTGSVEKKFDWETTSGIETEVADMSFVTKIVSEKVPSADTSKLAVIGYSYGSMSALVYQARNSAVKAVVSLDGGIGSLWGGFLLFQVKDFHISRVNKSILHLYSDLDEHYDLKWIENLVAADRYIVRIGKIPHGDFVEGAVIDALVYKNSARLEPYQKICHYTLQFLDQLLNSKSTSLRQVIDLRFLPQQCA